MTQLDRHCLEIDRCNQRGARMLSITDLLEAKTLPIDLAAYLLAAIGNGASCMVGANPGGAGKTTIMGALLNFVPAGIELLPAPDLGAVRQGLAASSPRRCFVCHEIRNARLYSYLWGEALRAYFKLPEAGHMLATNLHADTLEEAHEQICGDNQVPEARFRRMNLALFIEIKGSVRRIAKAWESDGNSGHRPIYSGARLAPASAGLVSEPTLARARLALERLAASSARTIRDVRSWLLEDYFKTGTKD